MPTFEITAPDGKTYDVEGPAGSTQEQALEHFKAQWKPEVAPVKPGVGTTDKAGAFHADPSQIPGNTNPNAQPGDTPDSRTTVPPTALQKIGTALGNVGTATAVGGAMGAIAPEVVTYGLGPLATAIPGIGPVIGPAIMAAGRAMRIARTAEIAAGALSGAISETAGQAVEAAGGTPAAGMAARLGGGIMAPGASSVASIFVAKPLKAAVGLVQKLTTDAAISVPKAEQAARRQLSSEALSTLPQLDLHATLMVGAKADIAAAKLAAEEMEAVALTKRADMLRAGQVDAGDIVAAARAEGARVQADAAARMRALDVATDGKIRTAARVQAMAEPELAKVGGYREVSDIGNELRTKVTGEQAQAIAARTQQYQELKAPRDAAVQAKEQAGQFLDKESGMIALKNELNTKLLSTKAGREASKVEITSGPRAGEAQGVARVKEAGVTTAYGKVLDAINNKRVQTGVNEEGAPTYQTFKNTFEALDHVRRKLGDAMKPGAEVEGYSALGKNISQDLYAKIAKIQEDYAGPSQKALQDFYSGAKAETTKFGTKAGKGMTAVDRIDPETFAKDPAALPGAYFKTQQGVQDLKELTGDPTLVQRAAQDYAVRQMAGKDSKQVRAWAAGQSDWMREVPGLQKSTEGYARQLERIESTTGKVEAATKGLQQERAAIREGLPAKVDATLERGAVRAETRVQGAAAAGEKTVADAAVAAKAHVADVTAKAQSVVKAGFPERNVRELLTSNKPEDIATAVRYIAGSPGGKVALEGSIRNVLATTPVAQVRQVWNGGLNRAIAESGLLSQKAYRKLDNDVQNLLIKSEPAVARTKIAALVTATLAAGGVAGAAGIVNLTGGNPNTKGQNRLSKEEVQRELERLTSE